MCGIGGFQAKSKFVFNANAFLTAVQANLRHRGPDGLGQWVAPSETIGLCHTRLAIVDLSSGGAQPMATLDGQVVITFNGEIYNWKQLRSQLEQRGINFYGQSDTEVILAGYMEWGYAVLQHLRGMFAFAIWDERTDTLFCARDRVGKKPFVYSQSAKGFFFASEIPSLLAIADEAQLDTQIDASSLAAMLLHNLRHIPDPATVYRGIRRLRPGHAMLVQSGQIMQSWRYWDPLEEARSIVQPINSVGLREIIADAIEIRRSADVPVGALLSGGVDSTAIVALAQKASQDPINTYALGFDTQDEDLRRAREMAKYLGTRHQEFYFDSEGQWDGFQKIVKTYGEPIMLLPLVHTYELCRAIRADGIKVVLAGHGADELFYGYTGMLNTQRLSRFVHYTESVASLMRFLPEKLRPRPLTVLATPRGQRKAALYRGYAQTIWHDLLEADPIDLVNYAEQEMRLWGQLAPNDYYIDESSFVGLMVENAHSVTIAGDLPAMLAGVEVRAPFLDQRVIAFSLATHWSQKFPPNGDLTKLKLILKQAVADLMPPEFLYAPKRGFGMGIQEKMVLLGPWQQQADELFHTYPNLGLFKPKKVLALWDKAVRDGHGPWALIAKLFAIGTWSHLRNV